MAAANVRRHGMGIPGPGPATLPRNLNDPTNVHVLMIHEAHLRSFFPVMGGQAKRKRGKELVMAFQRRMGVRVTNAGHDDFRHFCEIVSPFLRNDFETIAKQCVKQFQATCFSDDEANSTFLS
jgi:hypothetical protein